MAVYDYRSVEKFIFGKLAPRGYEIHQVPGTLCDGYICVAPDESMVNFIARVKALNEWSSGLTLRNCRKLPRWAVEFIENEGADGRAE